MPLPRDVPLDLDYLARVDWWSRVDVRGEGECWPWLQSTGSHGYGQTWDGLTVRLAHRVAWALEVEGQVPEGMTIDHSCHNKVCCNPRHLTPMSNVDNARKNLNDTKTHCPRGHPYDEANTYRPPSGKGGRRCRACMSARNDSRRQARRF